MTEYFPELNIHFLKLFGNRWAKRYERVPIELILLTMHNDIRFSKDYLEDEFIRREGFKPAKQKEAKYDIYFVVSYSKTLFDEARIGHSGKGYCEYFLQLIKGEIKKGVLQDFLDNAGYGQDKNQTQYSRLLTDRFRDDVYKEPPTSILWLQDWDIEVILQNCKNDFSLSPEMQYEPYVVLYATDKWSSLEQQNTNYDVPVAQDPKEKLELPTPVEPSDMNNIKRPDYSSKTKSEAKETTNKGDLEIDRQSAGKQKSTAKNFIEKLTIRYEDDTTISIQEPGKRPKSIPAGDLKFQLSKDDKGKTWEAFLEVLQDFPKHYFQLRSKDKKIRDSKKGLLKTINIKLLDYFKENYDFDPPKKYKLWERVKGKGSGLYKFKFKISINTDGNNFNANSFRMKFDEKVDEFRKTHDPQLGAEIQELAAQGLDEGVLTNEEVKRALNQERAQTEQNTPKGIKTEFFKNGFQIKTK